MSFDLGLSIPRNSPAGVHYVAANITTAEGCTLVAHSALDHLGGIDIVVNVLGGSEAPAGGFAALTSNALSSTSWHVRHAITAEKSR